MAVFAKDECKCIGCNDWVICGLVGRPQHVVKQPKTGSISSAGKSYRFISSEETPEVLAHGRRFSRCLPVIPQNADRSGDSAANQQPRLVERVSIGQNTGIATLRIRLVPILPPPQLTTMSDVDDYSTDKPFRVQFTHRLRFARDILGKDSAQLLQLLEASEGQTARVQFWIDRQVAQSNPELLDRIEQFTTRHAEQFQVCGKPHLVDGGEAIKNDVDVLRNMLRQMNFADLDRRSYVVVIGGGALLDAVGFATAIAHRGLRLIRIPTTTLAQADSGVGVKNGVNLFDKKNWLGAFAVPWAVINDQKLLDSLPDRDFRCGFSEAVKVSLLKEPAFFHWLHQNAESIGNRGPECSEAIRRSAHWHLRHITEGGDPFEMLEARPLDFGHWSAHKLETMTQFELRHGEAVAIGVAIDTIYSGLRHGLSDDAVELVLEALQKLGLLTAHPALDRTEELFTGLEEFRQHLGGRLTVTMLEDIGRPIDVHQVDREAMRQAIESVRERAATLQTR